MAEPELDDTALRLLQDARRAVLTTIDTRDGRPRSVPICFVTARDAGGSLLLYSAIDEKPKAGVDPRTLRRVRNLEADPRATILVDRWDENWTRLAFVEMICQGELVEPGVAEHGEAVAGLLAKYPQYRTHHLGDRPLLRFRCLHAAAWNAAVPQ